MNEQKSNLTIKEWAEQDRPREKLLIKGIGSLSDAELLAILIRAGNKHESAVELAKKILFDAGNNLNELGKFTIEALTAIKGIGMAKAVTILAALELGRRRNLTCAAEKTTIMKSDDVFNLFKPVLSDLKYEEFWILLLNRANKVVHKSRISQGGVSGTVIDVKLIIKMAIDKLSNAIILCHNHPSGNYEPSDLDIKITKQINEAARFMEISLLDHVIIAGDVYYSFADQGLIIKKDLNTSINNSLLTKQPPV
ncbi:MAG: DNA repair protein RadC [Bacteroidia bacterium]|nr:DNA repair protein RadC [Bacteroidia bacterium]